MEEGERDADKEVDKIRKEREATEGGERGEEGNRKSCIFRVILVCDVIGSDPQNRRFLE